MFTVTKEKEWIFGPNGGMFIGHPQRHEVYAVTPSASATWEDVAHELNQRGLQHNDIGGLVEVDSGCLRRQNPAVPNPVVGQTLKYDRVAQTYRGLLILM